MREIKFRAWDKESNCMCYDNFLIDGYGTSLSVIKGGVEPWPLEIMQYTGFKDELKQEIFEGDILEYRTYEEGGNQVANYTAQVEFIDGAFYPMSIARQNEDEFYNIEIRCIKVIGNIHENPEFLRGR